MVLVVPFWKGLSFSGDGLGDGLSVDGGGGGGVSGMNLRMAASFGCGGKCCFVLFFS